MDYTYIFSDISHLPSPVHVTRHRTGDSGNIQFSIDDLAIAIADQLIQLYGAYVAEWMDLPNISSSGTGFFGTTSEPMLTHA